jgi:DNA integrity scanning protein DisA with diadenylate cyclase activity
VFAEVLQTLQRWFRPADVIDICFVWILSYAGLAWFRDRASRTLGVLLAALVIVYGLARWLEMYLTILFFQYASIIGALSFVIVFQQEIRRGLERLLSLRWFAPTSTTLSGQTTDAIEAISESLALLAGNRIGALVVFPGYEPLDTHLTGGISTDAIPSVPLLQSIFHPSSPGHDGAITIVDDRIARLSVHLPLSTNVEQLGARGTRHAAALGLVERCDALAIAVSEERGTITMAHDGILQEIAPGELAGQLHRWHHDRSLPDSAATPRRAMWGIGLKLLSLAIAVALWFLLAFETETVQRTIVVPVEYRNLAEDWTVDRPPPAYAEVTLTGSEQSFRVLDASAMAVSLDLAQIQEETELLFSTVENLRNIPEEFRVEDVRPDSIFISVHRKSPDTPLE